MRRLFFRPEVGVSKDLLDRLKTFGLLGPNDRIESILVS